MFGKVYCDKEQALKIHSKVHDEFIKKYYSKKKDSIS